jgi:hypothetical protein
LEKVIAATTKVLFGPGAEVRSVVTGLQSPRISISSLPGGFPAHKVRELAVPFGSIVGLSVLGDTRQALVTYESPTQAEDALAALDGASIPSSEWDGNAGDLQTIQVRLVPMLHGAQGSVNSSTLKVVWYNPKVLAFVHLGWHCSHGLDLCSRLDGTVPRGSSAEISCELLDDSRTLKIGGLPGTTRQSDVETLIKNAQKLFNPKNTGRPYSPCGIGRECIRLIRVKDAPFVASDAEHLISSELGNHGELESFTVTDADFSASKSVGFAKFASGQDASRALHALDQKGLGQLGGQRLLMQNYYSCKFVTLTEIHTALVADLDAISESYVDHKNSSSPFSHVSFRTYPSERRVQIKMSSSNSAKLAEAKRRVAALLRGEIMQDERGSAMWNPVFATHYGVAFLKSQGEIRGGCAYADAQRLVIRSYGAPNVQDELRTAVLGFLQELRRATNEIPIPRVALRSILAYGIDRLSAACGAKSISMNVVTSTLSIDCDDEGASARVKAWLNSEISRIEGTDGNQPWTETGQHQLSEPSIVGGDQDCPVCLCEPTEPRLLECGHKICGHCLTNLIRQGKTAISAASFPMTCVMPKCAVPLSLSCMSSAVTAKEFDSILDQAFRWYIRTHATFFMCSTPDCPQVFSVQSSGQRPADDDVRSTSIQCADCLVILCAGCGQSHEGMTCQEHKETLEDPLHHFAKANDVRRCPKKGCGARIMKNGGCNHMTCPSCSSHICWVCMKLFARDEIYDHMRDDHGGIGI